MGKTTVKATHKPQITGILLSYQGYSKVVKTEIRIIYKWNMTILTHFSNTKLFIYRDSSYRKFRSNVQKIKTGNLIEIKRILYNSRYWFIPHTE